MKTELLRVRIEKQDQRLIEVAAKVQGVSVSQLARRAVVREARRVLGPEPHKLALAARED